MLAAGYLKLSLHDKGFGSEHPCILYMYPAREKTASQLQQKLLGTLPRLQIFNSGFTRRYDHWALLFAAGAVGAESPCMRETEREGEGRSEGEGERQPSAAEEAALSSVSELDLSGRGMLELKTEVCRNQFDCYSGSNGSSQAHTTRPRFA